MMYEASRSESGNKAAESRRELLQALPKLTSLVHGYFARRGFSIEERAELTQDVLLSAWRSLSQVDRHVDNVNVRAWLLRIAQRLMIDRLRWRMCWKHGGGAPEISLHDFTPDQLHLEATGHGSALAAPSRSPSDELLARELRDRLHDALSTLPPKMRSCLLLRIYQDLSIRAIAEVLQTTEPNVRANLYQARKRLQQQMTDGIEDEASK
jgi:RNA polymerase sigma factor (sigma-70 family)